MTVMDFFFVQEAKNGVACVRVCHLCVWCSCQTRGKVYPDTIPLNEFDFVFILFKKTTTNKRALLLLPS